MEISRHFVRVDGRRVHYRRCGNGPALLMVHQSPRSSTEYEPLMREWGRDFTCIAPDTPGFGESDPLPSGDATIDDFADATVAFIDALGIHRIGAYGFHSGGIILVTALRRHPRRFTALAVGGYAVWTADEMALFSDRYLPPFRPTAYGEHLTWLWNRVLEQSWFFPWFATEPAFRLSAAHADVAHVDAVVRELLDAGDAYRVGYGAVLRAPRDIPPPDAETPPVLITAYDGDPLQPHLQRLGDMPASWRAHPVATPVEHHAASRALLLAHQAPEPPPPAEAPDEGFVRVQAGGFDGMLHWRGRRGNALHCHAPGRSAALLDAPLAIDLPGHGLSDDWTGSADWGDWAAVVETAARALDAPRIVYEPLPAGDPAKLFPDLAPDRFGAYLTTAWQIVRAAVTFDPWYEANAAHARPFDSEMLAPDRLAAAHRALLQARAARTLAIARQRQEGDN